MNTKTKVTFVPRARAASITAWEAALSSLGAHNEPDESYALHNGLRIAYVVKYRIQRRQRGGPWRSRPIEAWASEQAWNNSTRNAEDFHHPLHTHRMTNFDQMQQWLEDFVEGNARNLSYEGVQHRASLVVDGLIAP